MKEIFGEITAIIVSYNPDRDLLGHLSAILPQIDSMIIIDNGSEAVITDMLEIFASESENIILILNKENIGLSHAQNIGIKQAEEQQADWILLLDDDSLADENMIENMQKSYFKQQKQSEIALIAPNHIDNNTQLTSPFITGKAKSLCFNRHRLQDGEARFVLCAIASGSLMRTKIISELGHMHADFFIDYIDTEFCMRIIAADYKILAVEDAILHHRLGNKTSHFIAGKKIIASNHSAQRRYTIYRNRVIVWKEYLLKVPSYIIYDAIASIYDLFRILLYEQHKITKISAAVKGLLVGLFTSYR